jgi:hypothetical protein
MRWRMSSSDNRRRSVNNRGSARPWIAVLGMVALLTGLFVPASASAANPVAYLAISPVTEHALVDSEQTWTVAVTDSSIAPVAGATVHAFVSGAHIQGMSTLSPTDSHGQTTFSYSAPSSGTDTITVFYDVNTNGTYESDTDIAATATVHWAYADDIILTPTDQTRSTGNPLSMTATVLDSDLTGLAGVDVDYQITGSNSRSGTLTTGTNGTISFADPDSIAGTDTITVSTGSLEDTTTVQWIDGAGVLLITPPTSSPAVNTTATLTATLTQANGDPVPDVPVYFSVSGENYVNTSGTTDANGEVTFQYSSTQVGSDTVTAYADFNRSGTQTGGEPSNTAHVNWVSGNGASLTLDPSSQTVSTGSQAMIGAHLTVPDENVDGVPVRFVVTGANTAASTVYVNASGDADIAYIGDSAGTDTVTAFADLNGNGSHDSGEPSATATVTFSGSSLDLSPSGQTRAVGAEASVTATYHNENGSSSGATLRYSISGPNSGSGSVTTDSNGNATISYTGTNPGRDTITVYVDANDNGSQDSGEPSATATVNWGLSVGLDLAPATTTPGVGSTAYIAVSLTSSNGDASGIPIRFNVSGANPMSGAMTTDGNGNTVISYQGNSAGTDTITAFPDLNNNGVQDSDEPTATTTITWGASSPSVFEPAQPAAAKAGCTYFVATQHNLCAGFAQYWNKFGGLEIFGMPLTEEFQENGVTVQYFERAEFQWHPGSWPERYDVALALLGNEVTAGRGNEAPFQTAAAKTSDDCTYYAETGHNLCAGFRSYWNQYGGLADFGFPISEEFQEKNPDTGQVYTVQYFQRARVEWHPGENPSRYDVELGRLGAQVMQIKYGVSFD